jgi:hypothetical protein
MGVCRGTCAGILLVASLLSPAAPSRGDTEEPLFSAERSGCTINASATTEGRTLIIRVQPHQGATAACVATESDTTGLIGLAFATLAIKQMETEGYRSVFLGRLIDYEWLGRHLAEHAAGDPRWSAMTGKTADGERAEAYVQRVLAVRSILDPIDTALEPYGYRAKGFSCEKAMVSGPDTKPFQPAWIVADKRLPFDALCHLTIEPLS